MKKFLATAAVLGSLVGTAHADPLVMDAARATNICQAFLPDAMADFSNHVKSEYPAIQPGDVQATTYTPSYRASNLQETFKQHITINGQDAFGQPVEVVQCVVSVALHGNLPLNMVHSVLLGYYVQHFPVLDKVLTQSEVMASN